MAITVTLAQSSGDLDTQSTFAFTPGTQPTSGSDIIVVCWAYCPSMSAAFVAGDCTDSSTNTWTLEKAIWNNSSGYAQNVGIWRKTAATTAAGWTVTINAHGASNSYGTVCVIEVPGSNALAADVTASNSGSAPNPSTGTTASTAQADEIAVIVLAAGSGSGTAVGTSPAGWTSVAKQASGASHEAGEIMYKILSATGTQSASWAGGAAEPWAAAIAVLKSTGGGGGTTVRQLAALGVG